MSQIHEDSTVHPLAEENKLLSSLLQEAVEESQQLFNKVQKLEELLGQERERTAIAEERLARLMVAENPQEEFLVVELESAKDALERGAVTMQELSSLARSALGAAGDSAFGPHQALDKAAAEIDHTLRNLRKAKPTL